MRRIALRLMRPSDSRQDLHLGLKHVRNPTNAAVGVEAEDDTCRLSAWHSESMIELYDVANLRQALMISEA